MLGFIILLFLRCNNVLELSTYTVGISFSATQKILCLLMQCWKVSRQTNSDQLTGSLSQVRTLCRLRRENKLH